MKTSKKLNKLIALAVLLGGVSCMHSAWADPVDPVDIVISSSGVDPNTYGGGSDANGIWGASGNQTVGQDVINSIKTSGDVALTVYGIKVESTDSFKVDSLSGGIDVKSTGGKAFDIYLLGTGTNTISNLGNITAETTSTTQHNQAAYGVYSKNTGSNTFSVGFADAGGSISVYSAECADNFTITSCGIRFDNGSTGTSEVLNVKTITAGVSGSNVSIGMTYGISDAAGTNTVTFTGAGSSITAKSSGNMAFGILLTGTGAKTISGLGRITVERTGNAGTYKNAFGISTCNINTDDKEFSVSFDSTNGGSISVYSAEGTNYGIIVNKDEGGKPIGTSEVLNVKSITAGVTKNDQGAEVISSGDVYGIKADAGTNTVAFTGAGSSIIAKSSGDSAYGIYCVGGTNTIGKLDDTKDYRLGSITATTSATGKYAYGIYSNGTADTFANTVSFKGNGGQAITATAATAANAYSIYAEGQGATTVNFESSILSGKIKQDGDATLTLNFNDGGVWNYVTGDVTGNVSVNVNSGGTIDTRTRDAQGEVTTAAVKTIDLGAGTFTAQSGSKISFDAGTSDSELKVDQIKAASASGTIALGSVNVLDTATAEWETAKTANIFVDSTGAALTGIEITGTTKTTTKDYEYTFTGGTSGVVSATSKKVKAELPTVIQGDSEVKTFSLTESETKLEEDMGELNMKNRDSFTIAGNGSILDANGKGGIQVTENNGKKGNLTVNDIAIKGFNKFVTNASECTVTLKNVTFFENTEKDVLDVENKGTMYVEGTTTFNNGIGGNGTIIIKENANVYYNKEAEQSFSNNVIVEKDATLDPVVSVFAEGVNVQVDGGGTLVLQPGTLFANIQQDAGSVLKVAAEDIKTTALLSGVDKASQLDVSAGTLQLTGTVKLNDSFKLVEGAAVTNGTITMADMWHVQADGLNGLLAEFIVDKGVIGFEVRNVLTAVEANTSALAGVQQGAAAMVNQLTDKVAENLTLALRPAAEGKYDKQVWASYINSKETVDDRDFWDLKGSNTAKYRGAIVGADFYTSDKVIAGMAISYAKGDISANTIDSTHVQNDSKYYGVSFYDRVTNGPVALTYDIGYQYGKNDISMSARENITADVDTQAYTAGVRAERAYKVSKTSTFAPFVSLRYLKLHTKEYKNSNQAKFDANDQNLFIPKLGVAWHGDFVNAKSGWSFKPVAEIGYIFNIGNRSAESKYVTATSRAFNTEYDVVDSGTYYGKLGFRVAKKNFFIGADYNYQKGSTTKNSRWNVNLGWSF